MQRRKHAQISRHNNQTGDWVLPCPMHFMWRIKKQNILGLGKAYRSVSLPPYKVAVGV